MQRLSPSENAVKFGLGNWLSDEAMAFFSQNGFVVFGQLFGHQERDQILKAVDAVVAGLPPKHADLQMGSAGTESPGRAGPIPS